MRLRFVGISGGVCVGYRCPVKLVGSDVPECVGGVRGVRRLPAGCSYTLYPPFFFPFKKWVRHSSPSSNLNRTPYPVLLHTGFSGQRQPTNPSRTIVGELTEISSACAGPRQQTSGCMSVFFHLVGQLRLQLTRCSPPSPLTKVDPENRARG